MQMSRRQILLIITGFLILSWLGASTVLFLFIKHKKGYDVIKFTEVTLPWNWSELRPKWGDYFVEKGIELHEQGQWDQAFYFIRVGVSKSPANLEGRLALADLLFQANDVIQAVRVLEAGLEHASKEEAFWAKLIRFLEYYQADQEIIRILSRGLKEDLVPDSQIEAATAALAKAYFHQAEYEEAVELIKDSNTISNQLVRSQILWDQGLEFLAIQNLESLNTMFPNQREVVPLLTRFYKDSGEREKALKLARITYLGNPYSIGAAVNYFRILDKDAPQEIDRFLVRVPEIYDNQDALFLLANFLSEKGFIAQLTTVIEQAGATFADSPLIWFLQVESLVNGSDFEGAASLLEAPPETINNLIPLHRILFQSLALTTYYAQGQDDKGRLAMQQLFVSGHIRPATLLRLTRKLIELDRPEEAGRVVQFLLKQNPGNQSALAELIRIDLRTQRTAQAIAQSRSLIENKTMPYQLVEELVTYLVEDRQLYHAEGAELVEQMLDALTPSKKRQLLEVL